jgi:hypothetical protein
MTNKQINFKLKIIFVVFGYFFIFLFGYSAKTHAQSILPLMVMPSRNEIEVTPGEKAYLNISFYNQSDDPVSGFFKTADFIVEDNKGTPRLIENPEEAPTKFAASNWFSLFYDRATLPAHDKVSLQTTIDIPADAHPGGRYVAVFFEQGSIIPKAAGTPEEAGLGTSSRIASLVYIKVKGPITEKALISRFFAPSFFEYGPIKITADILNRGDYHIAPRGIVSLTNMFGGLVDQKSLKEQNIFPDVSRTFENELGTKWMAGRYKIDLTGAYGNQGQVLAASIYVWVFPWRVATAAILTLIIIILIISKFYKNFVVKESSLEEELTREKTEIEKLKDQLRKRE